MTARAGAALVVVALAATVLAVLPTADASAAAYRYWSYWWGGESGWTYASAGAGTHRPADGSVEGWRFSVSGDGASSSRPPRADPDFTSLCAAAAPAPGKKRVGVVIDHGTDADSPDGQTPPPARGACVVVPEAATGAAVLAAVAAYRVEDGLVCGIDGYPARECAVVVGSPAASSSRPPTPAASRTTTRPTSRATTTVPTRAPTAAASSPAATTTRPPTPAAPSGTIPSTPPPTTPPPTTPTTPAATTPAPATTAAPESSVTPPAGDEQQVALATSAPSPPGPGGTPTGLLVGVLVVGAVAGAGTWLVRRGR